MEPPALRVSVRAMMSGIAAVAVSLVLIPSISHLAQMYVWFDQRPLVMGVVLNPQPVVEPRLGFALIPALSVIVALRKPSRPIVWATLCVDLFALVSWLSLRRAVVGPAAVLFWPDDLPRLLRERAVHDWPSTIAGMASILHFSTASEFIDLLALVGLLMILVSLVSWPLPHWLRASAVFPTLCFMFYCWATTMYLDRYWGPSDPPRVGLGIIPRASATELTEGLALFAVLMWLLAILALSVRRAQFL